MERPAYISDQCAADAERYGLDFDAMDCLRDAALKANNQDPTVPYDVVVKMMVDHWRASL